METLSIDGTIRHLVCPICLREGSLVYLENEDVVLCDTCKRQFHHNGPIISFIMLDKLDPTNVSEIEAHEIMISDEKSAEGAAKKDEWKTAYTDHMQWNMKKVIKLMEGYGPETILFSIGSGAGFELKLLLKIKQFTIVFSSDISEKMVSIVPKTLNQFQGNVGLFVSDFNNCPVIRKKGNLGLVYQALHHASDAHKSLEHLLQRNFSDLIIVEPVTNWFVEILAMLGLAKRVEYSGVKPDWFYIKKIKQIASEHNFAIDIETWWEIPHYCTPNWLGNRKMLWKPLFALIKVISWITGRVNFGSMAAVRFYER